MPYQHQYSRSLVSSSRRLRRELTESSISQQLPASSRINHPRLNTWRHCAADSIGSQTPTVPTQPVTVRVHSADASSHLTPSRQPPPSSDIMSKKDELPPVSDFSLEGILAAIQPEIEGTIDAIAEIMGRSRLTLANEYDSHMPPQGEIRASSHPPLLPVEEASSSNERLAADNVIIVGEDASLVDGSHTGSAAYGLLERLRAAPRPRRQRSDGPAPWAAGSSPPTYRTLSSPAILPDITQSPDPLPQIRSTRSATAARRLLRNNATKDQDSGKSSRSTNPVVSEMYLHAGANGRSAPNPPMVSEAGRNYPLYSYDESGLFGYEHPPTSPTPNSPGRFHSFQSRMQNLGFFNDLQDLASWVRRGGSSRRETRQNAETQLRDILDRHQVPVVDDPELQEEAELYD